MSIPFNRASVEGHELEYVRQSIDNGHISGDGPFTKRASAMLESILYPSSMSTSNAQVRSGAIEKLGAR